MERHRTNDMAMVTYLKQNGHMAVDVRWEPQAESVHWTFDATPSTMELIETFRRGEALVEPKEYNRLFALTKREMYGLADSHR